MLNPMLVSGDDAMPLEIPAFAGMTRLEMDRFKNNGLFCFSTKVCTR
jgi:hypothetical protein